MAKSAYQTSTEVMDAFGTKYPQAFDVPTYYGSGVYLRNPYLSWWEESLQSLSYWIGTHPYPPYPHISIRVTSRTKHPPGVPKTFQHDGETYKVVYEVRKTARML